MTTKKILKMLKYLTGAIAMSMFGAVLPSAMIQKTSIVLIELLISALAIVAFYIVDRLYKKR